MTPSSKILPFPQPASSEWITTYDQAVLASKDEATRAAYQRILRQFAGFTTTLPGMDHQFTPARLTSTVVDAYLSTLGQQGYSASHRQRVKSVLKGFCQWLLDEQQLLTRNPVRGVHVAAEQMRTPRVLTPEQRFVLRNLAEQHADLRGQAIFALGYWAGCRVGDVSHLLLVNTHVGPKLGWLLVGHKGEKHREIDLLNEVRRPLYQDLAPLFLCACTLQSLTFTLLAWGILGAPQARRVSPCLDRCPVQPKAGWSTNMRHQ